MTLAWGIFISPKILSMKSGTEKKCQKEKKRKKKNTGSNWIQYLCGQRVGKFHSRSVISKCFCIFFVGIAYQGKNDIVFRLFIIESIVASWIFLAPPGNNNRSIFIWGFLKDDIFWLVLKLEISYKVIISWRILISCRGFFWRLYFCMVKYLSFHNSSIGMLLDREERERQRETERLPRVLFFRSTNVFFIMSTAIGLF